MTFYVTFILYCAESSFSWL